MTKLGIERDKNATPPWVKEVKQLLLPPRKICREGRNFKVYLPAEYADVLDELVRSGKRVAGVLYVVD